MKPAVRENAAAPTNYFTPVFFCPRYSEHADDKIEPEDVPKGKDPDAVTVRERELDSAPESRTQIPDQKLDELPLDHEAQAKLTPS